MTKFGAGLDKLQEMYSSSPADVRGRGLTADDALRHYSRYVEFVKQTTGARAGRLLDAGCGNGWSSYLLARDGYDVTGLDLNAAFFEPPPLPGLRLTQGSMLDLPFADGSFDLVAAYQALEHVPDPGRALSEMLRVVKTGGTVTVVGPNLLSVLTPLLGMGVYAWRNRPLRTALVRAPGMPRHPGGNTLPENAASLLRNGLSLLRKVTRGNARFSMREPDLNPPFHADNDACYLCNPVDLVKFFRSHGCRVLRCGAPGRPPLSWLLTTGTFVTARKGR